MKLSMGVFTEVPIKRLVAWPQHPVLVWPDRKRPAYDSLGPFQWMVGCLKGALGLTKLGRLKKLCPIYLLTVVKPVMRLYLPPWGMVRKIYLVQIPENMKIVRCLPKSVTHVKWQHFFRKVIKIYVKCKLYSLIVTLLFIINQQIFILYLNNVGDRLR